MSRFPIATALIDSFKEGYTRQTAKSDLMAGLVVSLIALPLSMALAIAVGLPPQHGLYTAIIAGIATALLGGSRFQVTGPTAAFVAILAPIVTQYGLPGLIWCELMAGAILILMGALRLGRFIEHVPYAVTTGFTAGIAVVIATLSLNDLLGLHIESLGEHYWDKVSAIVMYLPHFTAVELIVGLVTLAIMIVLPRWTRIPAAVAGIAVGTVMALIAMKLGYHVDTIASRFSYVGAGQTIGAGIPPYLPQLHWPQLMALTPLIIPAITVALLAALESLLSSTVADNITKISHDPNAELVGVGFGNLLAGLFGGIPATGALARTAANIHAGAKTPFSSVMHSLFLAVYMIALAPYISEIPMAALAALLLITAWRMAHVHLVLEIILAANHKDTAILIVTFVLTVAVDMVAGVGAGLLLAYLLRTRSIDR